MNKPLSKQQMIEALDTDLGKKMAAMAKAEGHKQPKKRPERQGVPLPRVKPFDPCKDVQAEIERLRWVSDECNRDLRTATNQRAAARKKIRQIRGTI